MKKLTQHDNNIVNGSSFGGLYLHASLERLLDVFGQPTEVGSGDNKIQLDWVFSDSSQEDIDNDNVKCFTIYDWKTNTPIHEINEWNVGRKGISRDEVHAILVEMGLTRGDEIVYANE